MPSTINVRLSAVRKLVHEAKRNGWVSAEEAAAITDIPNVRQQGTRLGNWLNKEQARELLAIPNRETLKGVRENRWVIADLSGKGKRVRTVAVSIWVKHGINAWQTAAGIEGGRLFRSIRKGGKVGKSLSDWAGWSVVTGTAKEIGIENFGAHDLRRTCAKLCRKAGSDLEQIKFLMGHSSIQTTELHLGSEQDIAIAMNDSIGL